MSSNVQRCLTKAVVIGETDLLKGMDELCVTTHWIVTYMHQLGTLDPEPPISQSFLCELVFGMAFWKDFNCRVELLFSVKT